MSSLRNSIIRLAHARTDLRPHLLPILREASVPPNVRGFLLILGGLVTQYDMRNSRRPGYNPNALAMYLGVVNDITAAFKSKADSTDPADLQELKAAVEHGFLPGFSPANKFVKIVDTFLTTGKVPGYPISRG